MSKPLRMLFAARSCLLDDSSGAAVACRTQLAAMKRRGVAVAALCGGVLDAGVEVDLTRWLAERGRRVEVVEPSAAGSGSATDLPKHVRAVDGDLEVTIHLGAGATPHEPDDAEAADFMRLYEHLLQTHAPDVVVGHGGGRINREVMARARARGIATVFALHDLAHHDAGPFADVDAVVVPSRFAADFHRESLGLACHVLPNLVDADRVRAERVDPRYVTFVNPSAQKGVYAFARIADELARRRPDIRCWSSRRGGPRRPWPRAGRTFGRAGPST